MIVNKYLFFFPRVSCSPVVNTRSSRVLRVSASPQQRALLAGARCSSTRSQHNFRSGLCPEVELKAPLFGSCSSAAFHVKHNGRSSWQWPFAAHRKEGVTKGQNIATGTREERIQAGKTGNISRVVLMPLQLASGAKLTRVEEAPFSLEVSPQFAPLCPAPEG